MWAEAAIEAVRARAAAARATAEQRWHDAVGALAAEPLDRWEVKLRDAGRLTLNFHPDRIGRRGRAVAAGLLQSGRYQSQWVTGLSAGSRSAVPGGEREGWERLLYAGAYDGADPTVTDFPVYGSFDLAFDPHGGSPRFGSSFVILHRHVLDRTTLCVGDSHVGPADVGTMGEPGCILAGLAEQAARGQLLRRGLAVDEFLEACAGSYWSARPSRVLDGYVEAQVHGGVWLERDAEAIVLDPSFRQTPVEDDLGAAAERYGFSLAWHGGSEMYAKEVPEDFRGPTMPSLARRVAHADGLVDAHAIGRAAAELAFGEPTAMGDAPESELQQLKYLWHTVLVHGHDASRATE